MAGFSLPAIRTADREFLTEVARGFAGALIFALPMLMTAEMWSLGFYVDPLRLALLLLLTFPLLVGLSRYGGMRPTAHLRDGVMDAFVAIAIATISAAIMLGLFGLLTFDMHPREIIGKVAIQAVPGSMGVMLARNQMKESEAEEELRREHPSYLGELFLMAAGALFFSLNIAPTEEVILISHKMTIWHELVTILLSLLLMYGFVYSVKFSGTKPTRDAPFLSVFARFTVAGYAVVLLVSLYVLWTFGRTDGSSSDDVVGITIVLAFPGAIGAAAARLIL